MDDVPWKLPQLFYFSFARKLLRNILAPPLRSFQGHGAEGVILLFNAPVTKNDNDDYWDAAVGGEKHDSSFPLLLSLIFLGR
jgi:hypothetical protein